MRRLPFALLLVLLPAPLAAQRFFPGVENNGRINVQINATLGDGAADYQPVSGLVLTLHLSATDSLRLRADEAGVLQFAVPGGRYRIATAEAVDLQGQRFRWSLPLVVQRGMGTVHLTAQNATISAASTFGTQPRSDANREDTLTAETASAQVGESAPAMSTVPATQMTVYLGGGTKEPGLDLPALSAGFLYFNNTNPWALGIDAALEGTMQDATYGSVSTEQGYSVNALGGGSLRVGDGRIGVAGLIGTRATGKSCAGDSYLGYQCYADTEPSVNYKLNLGGVVHVSFKRVLVGFRYTEQSGQVIVGGVF